MATRPAGPRAEVMDGLPRTAGHLTAISIAPAAASALRSRLDAVLRACGFVLITDVSSDKVTEYLHGLRRDPARTLLPPGQEWFTPAELRAPLGGVRPPQLARVLRREALTVKGEGKARRYPRATVETLQDRYCRGIGISTSNGYLVAIKDFSWWLAQQERTDPDWLVSLAALTQRPTRGTDAGHRLQRGHDDEALRQPRRAGRDGRSIRRVAGAAPAEEIAELGRSGGVHSR